MMNIINKLKIKNNPRLKSWLPAFGVMLMVVIFIANIYSLIKIEEINNKILLYKYRLTTSPAQKIPSTQALAQYREYQSNLTALSESLLTKNRELDLVNYLDNQADKYNLEVDIDINKKAAVINEYFFTTPLNLSLKGSYQNIINYLAEFSALTSVNIQELDLKPEVTTGDIEMRIKARAFWQEPLNY